MGGSPSSSGGSGPRGGSTRKPSAKPAGLLPINFLSAAATAAERQGCCQCDRCQAGAGARRRRGAGAPGRMLLRCAWRGLPRWVRLIPLSACPFVATYVFSASYDWRESCEEAAARNGRCDEVVLLSGSRGQACATNMGWWCVWGTLRGSANPLGPAVAPFPLQQLCGGSLVPRAAACLCARRWRSAPRCLGGSAALAPTAAAPRRRRRPR